MTNETKYLTTAQVGEIFQVKADTVREWIKSGRLKGIQINGYWRVSNEDVQAFAAEKYNLEENDE